MTVGCLLLRAAVLVAAVAAVASGGARAAAPRMLAPRASPPAALDCMVRNLAFEYAQHLLPDRKGRLQSVFAALELATLCNVTAQPVSSPAGGPPGPPRPAPRLAPLPRSGATPSSSPTFYCDATAGSDSNPGTLAKPFRTIGAGVAAARLVTGPAQVLLRKGTFFLGGSLRLAAPADDGLTIAAYPGEEGQVEVSGGVPLGPLKWAPYNVSKSRVTVEAGQNDVWGTPFGGNNATTFLYGEVGTAQACADACAGLARCTGYTWHDDDPVNGEWRRQCYWRSDGFWQPVPQSHHVSGRKVARNVWVATLPRSALEALGPTGTFDGLRVDGGRAIRARWPNGDPETVQYPAGYHGEATTKWAPPRAPATTATTVVVGTPNRTDAMTGYLTNWQVGVGGACEGFFEPPSGYWCAPDPPRGKTYTVRVPSGLMYDNASFDGRVWPHWRANESVLMAFRNGHWFSYAFLIDAYDPAARRLGWTKGGFQGGEGADTAGAWAVENVFDELDAPREWFFDAPTSKLYYYHNATAGTPPPPTAAFVATNPRAKVLVNASGTLSRPLRGVTLRDLRFTTAAHSWLDAHGLPSDGGGDWAVARQAAVFLERTEGASVVNCTFERVDGNALMVSGYARNTTIAGNEFVWVGESAIVAWGNTQDVGGRTDRLPPGVGIDATALDLPLDTAVRGNLCHEIGMFQKQVSCYFQAKAARTSLAGNVFFNGPRAGINLNDGLGGGTLIEGNLVFNMVRETSDHGAINTWDRQPYWTALGNAQGEPSLTPAYNVVRGNFMSNRYNPQEAVDNDDGSRYYHTDGNFLPFSVNGLKNDFGGADNIHTNNLYLQLQGGVCMSDGTSQLLGHEDQFANNTCVLLGPTDTTYARFSCGQKPPLGTARLGGNRVFTTSGNASECGMAVAAYQAASGNDLGTTVHTLPSVATIEGWARALLGLPS